MHRLFESLDDLYAYMKVDKDWDGAEATQRNRYPIRFILFENFRDFNQFINEKPDGLLAFPIKQVLEQEYSDLFPTFTELSKWVRDYVKHLPANDYILFPVSEMARFYESRQFLSLVKTIKGVNPPADGQQSHIRVYIPIVGMQSKMSDFMTDTQTYVWELKSHKDSGSYNLILARDTYGVTGLESRYSVVRNLHEWLDLWTKGEDVRQDIICTSRNIFLNAVNAQPDNAFSYTECRNAHEFLTKGLKLDFGGIQPSGDDDGKWENLASLIDIEDFDFDSFINHRFDTFRIQSGSDFIKTWFDCETDFDRWLLSIYFRRVKGDRGYVCESLKSCRNLNTTELFSMFSTRIFDLPANDETIRERRAVLKAGEEHNVCITYDAERQVYAKLSAMMSGEPEARYSAVRLMTALSESDRRLVVESLGKGRIERSDVERIYPDLFHYTAPFGLPLEVSNQWIGHYFDAYRIAKIADSNDAVRSLVNEYNASAATFQHWVDNLKTVKTHLHGRSDIDVFYWIDGLGVDWMPFIANIVKEYSHENIYLNEMYIARAILPTTTSVNKSSLEQLVPEGRLEKIGDLDSLAHRNKTYPQYIIDEMEAVRKAVCRVLSQYNGKKITFISDHGISYMAQYGKGLNLAGMADNHEGRTAICTSGTPVPDDKYIILDDGSTVCALRDDSLGAKTPKGHGAHGGATPEEVLVPIIIVSGMRNDDLYSVGLLSEKVDNTNPVVRFRITGLNSVDIPLVEYNNVSYKLSREGNNIFVSERLNLVGTANNVILHIGNYNKQFKVKVSIGVEEDDLFADI